MKNDAIYFVLCDDTQWLAVMMPNYCVNTVNYDDMYPFTYTIDCSMETWWHVSVIVPSDELKHRGLFSYKLKDASCSFIAELWDQVAGCRYLEKVCVVHVFWMVDHKFAMKHDGHWPFWGEWLPIFYGLSAFQWYQWPGIVNECFSQDSRFQKSLKEGAFHVLFFFHPVAWPLSGGMAVPWQPCGKPLPYKRLPWLGTMTGVTGFQGLAMTGMNKWPSKCQW